MGKKKRSPAQLAADKARSVSMKAKIQTNGSDIKQNDDIEQLKAQIEELKKVAFFNRTEVASTKTVKTKYSFDPAIYPDPRPRLRGEEKLKPFAFDYHYELGWEVKKVDSEEDGIKIRQPRFELELWQKIADDEGNIKKKALRHKWMFFEDPDSYIAIAGQQGVEVPEFLEKDFLDEMRYLGFRDCVLEMFYPPKSTSIDRTREEVIGNQLMTVIEVTTDVGAPAPDLSFKRLNG